ncbi:hypothetical protein E7Y31_23275, partial [Candidatus Frankia alpina]
MSLVCGFRMERGKACHDTAAPVGWGERERSKRLIREELSTDAGCAGGPARSSEEASVMGAERRGRIARGLVVWPTGRCPGGVRWSG